MAELRLDGLKSFSIIIDADSDKSGTGAGIQV